MKLLIPISVLVFSQLISIHSMQAQQNTQAGISQLIEGRVLNPDKTTPVEYATVLLLSANDSSLVKGATTDSVGNFTIEINDAANARYFISISFIGYATYTGQPFGLPSNHEVLNPIILSENSKELSEVVVQGEKLAVEVKLGKTVVNVDNSAFKTANTALDVLSRSPGVFVSGDGNSLSLKGNTSPTIIIDGKTVPITLDEVKSIPRENIEQIEIIANPTAEYEGDRKAIINIKLKREKTLGMNGSLYLGYGYNRYSQYFTGINGSYKTRKLVFFGRYNYSNNNGFYGFESTRKIDNPSGMTEIALNSRDTYTPIFHQYNAGVDYSLNDRHVLGIMAKGYVSGNNSNFVSETDVRTKKDDQTDFTVTELDTQNQNDVLATNQLINMNYRGTLGDNESQLTADLNYSGYQTQQEQKVRTVSEQTPERPGNQITGNISSDLTLASARLDYSYPLENSGLKLGTKASWVSSADNLDFDTLVNDQWTDDVRRSNQFDYKERILAGYFLYSHQFEKFEMQLGLRVEDTKTEGYSLTLNNTVNRHYARWLPSVLTQYKINNDHSMNLEYTRRLSRPNFRDLNPFTFYLDPFTYTEGNPFLLPTDIHKTSLAYNYREWATSVAYRHESDIISQMPFQDEETNITRFTRVNLDRLDAIAWDLWIPLQITRWYKLRPYMVATYNQYQSGYLTSSFNRSRITYQTSIYNSFLLPKDFTVSLSFYYRSPSIENFVDMKSIYSISAGLNKKLWNGKGNLNINFNDIFYTLIERRSVAFENINLTSIQERGTQSLNVRLSYRFGRSTFNKRDRETGSSDEEKRVKPSY